MKHALKLVASLALAGGLFAAPAAAETALSSSDREVIDRVEDYLDGITTLRADFSQQTDNGGYGEGKFYLSRPGRLRFEYEVPNDDFIVADGSHIYYWDSELNQQSQAPIRSTLAHFFLREDLSLDADVRVSDVEQADGMITVTVVQSENPREGQLTLHFSDLPMQLRKWEVRDAQGVNTEIALSNTRFGGDLDRDMFYFRRPQ